MLRRLPILLAQIKAGNISESLLKRIRQIVYSLYRAKQFQKSIQQFTQISIGMSTILMNLENSKTSDRYRLVLNLTDKMDKRIKLSDLNIYYK